MVCPELGTREEGWAGARDSIQVWDRVLGNIQPLEPSVLPPRLCTGSKLEPRAEAGKEPRHSNKHLSILAPAPQ